MVKGNFNYLYSVWICKGDLNERHDGNSNPMQSYLFCIKASGGIVIRNSYNINYANSMELDLIREVLFICFNRKSIFNDFLEK